MSFKIKQPDGSFRNLPFIHGKSAYQVATENGFTGTQQEWLQSLKGEKGDRGEIGNVNLDDYATVEYVDNNMSTHTHNQYLTEHQSLEGLATEAYVDSKTPFFKIEDIVFELTREQIQEAYDNRDLNDSSLYFETDNSYIIDEDADYVLEYNGYYIDCDYVDFEEIDFHDIDDEENQISGGLFYKGFNKNWDKDETKAIIQINRFSKESPSTIVSGMRLLKTSSYKLNKFDLGKDIDFRNSISVGRKRNSKIGNYSSALGRDTVASRLNSHAEGYSTTASGNASHAEGYSTTASGDGSHSEGLHTIASGEKQHVQGKYNIEDTANKYAHIVGNGTSNTARSNAHTLDWNGNGWYKGKLSQDGTPTEDKDLTTKEYVDDAINTLIDNNKYILIKDDNPLTINKADITDNPDSVIAIDNLTGAYGSLVANEDGTYTYTLNTIMLDIETFIFTIDGVEQPLVIVPYKEMMYNDDNPAITYTDYWINDTNENYINGTAHKSNGDTTNLATATIAFTGSGVNLYSYTDINTGRIRVQLYKINEDGSKSSIETNIKDTRSNSGSFYQTIMFSLSLKENANYEIVITVNKGGLFYLEGIKIFNTIENPNDKMINMFYLEEQYENNNKNDCLYTTKKNNVFVPTYLYHPATKKYVDDSVANVDFPKVVDLGENPKLNENDYSLIENWTYGTGFFKVTWTGKIDICLNNQGEIIYKGFWLTTPLYIFVERYVNTSDTKQIRFKDLMSDEYFDAYYDIVDNVVTQYSYYQERYFNRAEYYSKRDIDNKNYATEEYVDDSISAIPQPDLSNYSTTDHTHSQYLTEHQSLAEYYNKTEIDNKLRAKANSNHSHVNYVTNTEFEDFRNKLETYSIVYYGDGTTSTGVLNNYYSVNTFGCWVIDSNEVVWNDYKYKIEILNNNNEVLHTLSENDAVYSTTTEGYGEWTYSFESNGEGYIFRIFNINYQGERKLCISWDEAGNYYAIKISKKIISYYTKEEIDNKGYITNLPIEVSDIQPIAEKNIPLWYDTSEEDEVINIYTKEEIDNKGYIINDDVLSKTNTTEYTPTADYHPSTKKYVDDAIANINMSSNGSAPDLTNYATIEYVNQRLNNLSIRTISQEEYDALLVKDPNVLYLVTTN